MELKSNLTDRLAEAEQGQSHLDEYSQKLISYTATLTEYETSVNNILKTNITIAENKIPLDEVNVRSLLYIVFTVYNPLCHSFIEAFHFNGKVCDYTCYTFGTLSWSQT